MLKVGDKVRNTVTGNMLTIISICGDILKVGNGGKEYAEWRSEACSKSFDNEPLPYLDIPRDEDFDHNGELMVFQKNNGWRIYKKDAALKALRMCNYARWCKMPDWTPREPLLGSCKDCKDFKDADSLTCDLCWKHRKEIPAPFYTENNIPCHLEGEE